MKHYVPLVMMMVATLTACDRVTVNNADGEVGLLVDGQGTPDPINDLRLSRTDTGMSEFRVGNLTAASGPDRNEVIGFGAGRAPARLQTAWTEDDDSFNFGLGQPIPVNLTFWIIQGPVPTQEFRIGLALARTDLIWADERAGLVVGDVDIIDATNDPDITNAILNSVGGDNRNWDDFSDDIGFNANRINIYWINTVEGSMSTGWSDFGGRIVFGQLGSDHLLSHEIGHALELFHPPGSLAASFNAQNVMTSSSNSRSFLTEGQTFRAHFNTNSAVNAIYMARPGQPVAACQSSAETPECPGLQRRIWADGAFAPN